MIEIFFGAVCGICKKWHFISCGRRTAYFSTSSKQVYEKKEDEFGVSLFDRGKSKITLNDTGKVATKYAEKVLETDRKMLERTVAFDRSQRTITFGSCASLLLMSLFQLFKNIFVKWQSHLKLPVMTNLYRA